MSKTTDTSERYALLGHNQISIADGTDAEAELFRVLKWQSRAHSLASLAPHERSDDHLFAEGSMRRFIDSTLIVFGMLALAVRGWQ
jgi:hypothetical protein